MQQDEFKPRQLEAFTGRNATCPEIVSAPPADNDAWCCIAVQSGLSKPSLAGLFRALKMCMTCLLSQYCPWHTLHNWRCGLLECMQAAATHPATVSALHTCACTPQMLSPFGLCAGSLHTGSQLLHACKGAGRAVLLMGKGQSVRWIAMALAPLIQLPQSQLVKVMAYACMPICFPSEQVYYSKHCAQLLS